MSLKDPVLMRILGILTAVIVTGLSLARFGLPQILPGIWSSVLALAVLTAVSVMTVVYVFRRELGTPFEELLGSIRRLAAGNFDLKVRLGPDTSLNLQLLADALNEMTDQYREAMAEAEANRSKLSGITSSLIDGLVVVDQELRIVLSNPAAQQLLGIESDPQGRFLLEVIRNYDLVQAVNEALREKSVSVQEISLFTPQKRILRAHATPITDERGKAVGVATILHDVTELKHLEQVRSDFVANVSHELRTPLTSIKGFIETLLEGAADDPDTRKHFLQIIGQETARMVAIVNDLLELSRLEAGDQEWKPELVDIAEVINRSAETCTPQAQQKRITIEKNLPSDLPKVPGVESMLLQVFINLIDNAVKYTPEGGHIEITADTSGQKRLSIHVIDNGVGIPKKHLPRIFERFYRVDKGRSRQMGGTGLGLAIVKHIVEKHHGTVSVKSEVGEGTTFTVTLPTAPSEVNEMAQSS